MWNLALECSGITGSVALCRRNNACTSKNLTENLGSVQTLAISIEHLLRSEGIDRPDMISVTVGPGSFTGLRVGITTAKVLAMAWNLTIAPVDSLHAIAARAARHAAPKDVPILIVPVINAFRRQVFAGLWLRCGDSLECLARSQVLDAELWQAEPVLSLRKNSTQWKDGLDGPLPTVVITGPGLDCYLPRDKSLHLCDAQWRLPAAEDVAALGWDALDAGRTQSSVELLPNYVRASAAEEARLRA